MAFDQPTRNRLGGLVSDARAMLVEEFTRQLQGDYGLDPATGVAAELDSLSHLDDGRRETARLLRETMEHYVAGGMRQDAKAHREALDRIIREQAFTVLNRLCALRMAEARGLLIESIGKGHDSKGFALYHRVAGPALGETGDAYRAYLFSIFDEFAVDLPALFDRYSPQGRLFPRDTVLRELLALINATDIESLWAEDETIGWIYQYFNSKEERQQMRKESAAPRNSRELAVRNQFFTPRYVVEFLTDNTLGRIWYEMTRGETSLAESCRFLVRRPTEIFLEPPDHFNLSEPNSWVRQAQSGDLSVLADDPTEWELATIALTINGYEVAEQVGGYGDLLEWAGEKIRTFERTGVLPSSSLDLWLLLFAVQRQWRIVTGSGPAGEDFLSLWRRIYHEWKAAMQSRGADLSQEELLRQPVYIFHRPLKDPRDIKMLDPACGSMHFGLYAFDLYERIYEEAWAIEAENGTRAMIRPDGMQPLTKSYRDKEAFLRDVPRLILAHNIHGIDIDPRAVQIAGLSLWLRAQRSWQAAGVAAADRPIITRSNVVVAEPMPGEREMLDEFVKGLQPPLLGDLVRVVFDKMRLAGETGSLLKIEEEIRTTIDTTRRDYNAEVLQRKKDAGYLPGLAPSREPTLLDLMDLPDPEAFWDEAEERVLMALAEYAALAEEDGSYRRRLFAGDAVRGFALIDLCRGRYDVVLMNPPFGSASLSSQDYIGQCYPFSKKDVYAAFVERAVDLTHESGLIGAITNRVGFFIKTFERWRKEVLSKLTNPTVIADLGLGVMDDALVEAAAYCLSKHLGGTTTIARLLGIRDKKLGLETSINDINHANPVSNVHIVRVADFNSIPGAPFAYWVSEGIRAIFNSMPIFASGDRFSKQGLATADDFRFLRAWWEVPSIRILRSNEAPDWRQDMPLFRDWCKQKAKIIQPWVPFAKGGEYSPFYADLHLLINWRNEGAEISSYLNPGTGAPYSNIWMLSKTASDHFFRPGITWPERTASGYAPQELPAGSIFSRGGQAMLAESSNVLQQVLAIHNTRVYQYFVELLIGLGEESVSGSAARHYNNGLIGRLPFPLSVIQEHGPTLLNLSHRLLINRKQESLHQEPAWLFGGMHIKPTTIHQTYHELTEISLSQELKSFDISAQIEQIVRTGFGLSDTDIKEIIEIVGPHPCLDLPEREFYDIDLDIRALASKKIDALIDEVVEAGTPSRSITKKSYFVNREHEILAQYYNCDVRIIVARHRELGIAPVDGLELFTTSMISMLCGTTLGRWDIRNVTGERASLELPAPFAPLSACPPGMLQNDKGLPAEPDDVPSDYPLRISWPGVLVDDEGHPEDIVGRVHEALAVIWPDTHEDIEAEACAILKVDGLRDYFARTDRFFTDHLSRYSKSRRVAPIYWPLSSPNGAYTIWLYYHRLTGQTLYQVVNDFVDPKLKRTSEDAGRLRARSGRSKAEEKELERLIDLEAELKTFREELLRVAGFWRPNLNDGVQITAAPLWRLFRYKPWQKRLKETWEKLEAGEYDWAHLAYSIWPDRVRGKCVTDKSLAIAHDLEQLYVEPPDAPKRKRQTQAVEEDLEETADVD